jgi:hypothetical protein
MGPTEGVHGGTPQGGPIEHNAESGQKLTSNKKTDPVATTGSAMLLNTLYLALYLANVYMVQ